MTWVMDGICPRCGHCGSGGGCLNCEQRGREVPLMVPRTIKHVREGVPDPLFFLTPTGEVVPT